MIRSPIKVPYFKAVLSGKHFECSNNLFGKVLLL